MSALVDALSRLSQSLKTSGSFHTDTPKTRHTPQAPPIQLPPIPSLRVELLAIGLSTGLVEQLTTEFNEQCKRLQAAAQANWLKLSSGLAAIPTHRHNDPASFSTRCADVIQIRYLNRIKECTDYTLRRAKDLHLEELKTHDSTNKTTRFQSSFKPLLENYFQENPFPDRQEKETLASKTRMDYRQIYTWFQNRRARARRDGERLKRKLPGLNQDNLIEKTQGSFHFQSEGESAACVIDTDDTLSEVEICDSTPRKRDTSIFDSPHAGSSNHTILPHYPYISSAVPSRPIKTDHLSMFPRQRQDSVTYRKQQHPGDRLDAFLNQLNIIVLSSEEASYILSNHRSFEFKYPLRPSSEPNNQYTSDQLDPFTRKIRVLSTCASRSFSEAFECHDNSSSLGDSGEYLFSPPAKRRRINNLEADGHSSLMSLAIVCSEAPITDKEVVASKHISTSTNVTHRSPYSSLSPASSVASPLSSIHSPEATPPPSSPLSQTPSFASDSSDNIFSSGSISVIGSNSFPSSITNSPSSHSLDFSDSPSPAPSTSSEEELFGIDPRIRIRSLISSDRSTCSLPTSIEHIPQVARRVTTRGGHFTSSAANSMMRLDF